jgi:hypothetical protein
MLTCREARCKDKSTPGVDKPGQRQQSGLLTEGAACTPRVLGGNRQGDRPALVRQLPRPPSGQVGLIPVTNQDRQ